MHNVYIYTNKSAFQFAKLGMKWVACFHGIKQAMRVAGRSINQSINPRRYMHTFFFHDIVLVFPWSLLYIRLQRSTGVRLCYGITTHVRFYYGVRLLLSVPFLVARVVHGSRTTGSYVYHFRLLYVVPLYCLKFKILENYLKFHSEFTPILHQTFKFGEFWSVFC